MINRRQRLGLSLSAIVPVATLLCAQLASTTAAAADPFKLGVEQKERMQNSDSLGGYADYPAPQMIQQQPAPDSRPPVNLNGRLNDQAPKRPPIQLQAQKVALPPSFMGAWLVSGQRVKVEAMPEFQAGAEQAFGMMTQNTWNISGSPQAGYQMSNDIGVSTSIVVDRVEGNTAFIRYQHPVKNTMAQEAIVMSLVPGGAQFNGLERISIVKEGMPQPRAKVTYKLVGRRR